jgi:threonine/homoserine/homoserine lactone efflux protein
MTSDVDGSDTVTGLFSGPDGLVVTTDAVSADWTSSPWTLAGLVLVGCVAVTALLGVVIPVLADLVFGWIPQFVLL